MHLLSFQPRTTIFRDRVLYIYIFLYLFSQESETSEVVCYIDIPSFVFSAKNDKLEKCYLPAGRYTYPFHYQLPAHLPCSFEGEYGYIRYWVKAVIEKGFEQCHVTKMPFTVISPLDLNVVPDSNVRTFYK